ncbi:catechol 2,3-dioxygenase-like lactoylglutathione lyase family enzyme [Fictibacillus halophilus]|uniref:Catechol 2,3-dioxygenase-like lactoylglutathione lyase family enzyme n=1 Tax=Fictibacillus halophilus TaxID=1610490 RepID=A0ABV2LD25_9BACL|nr:VOC family protein [Fictibacillus halophilus]
MTIQTNVIQKVGQVAVPVLDIKRSIHFYKDVLGLQLLFSTDNMAFFDCNGLRILLTLPEKEEFAGASSVIYFHVGNITEAYKELKNKEITFLDSPHIVAKMESTETWMVFFKDSEGNTHALMSEVVTS